MKVAIASDHAGFELKEILIRSVTGIEWVDLGPTSTDSVDYPDFAVKLATHIGLDVDLGVLICGSGVGMSIAANRFNNIRAVLAESPEVARLSREHNHANVLCLGARIVTEDRAREILHAFLNAIPDPGPRHARRIEKLGEL